jgi:hypothetical protein
LSGASDRYGGQAGRGQAGKPVYLKLHVFGYSRNAPYFFFYRYLHIPEKNWYPWEKMQVDIPRYDVEDKTTGFVLGSGSATGTRSGASRFAHGCKKAGSVSSRRRIARRMRTLTLNQLTEQGSCNARRLGRFIEGVHNYYAGARL